MIGIIHYGMGNVTSVKNAFDFLNIPCKIISKANELSDVSHIILPGVGAFPQGMENLRESGFADAIYKNILEQNKPFLGLCLGMQLLATVSYEGRETLGLNLIPGKVSLLPDKDVLIPQIGWNNIEITRANGLIKDDVDFYFVHSYYFQTEESDDVIATVDYGINFAAAVNRKNIYGTQFHPEKSQAAGLEILKNFSRL